MSTSEEICNAPLKTKEGRCERQASMADGRCKFHTNEKSADSELERKYENVVYTDRGGYYKSLPEEDQDWIDAVVDSLMDDAPFTRDSVGKLEKVRSVAVDMHKKRRADEYIHKKGMAQTEDVGFHEQYGPIQETKENVLHITADRLSREARMTLKDLEIIGNDSDDGNAEDVGESVIEALSQSVDEEDE